MRAIGCVHMAAKRAVLGLDAPKVWTIPSGADFLGVLAATLAEESRLAKDPAALSDALIYVPNRRSARALAFRLHLAAGGGAILPPDIRALGDLESEEAPPSAEIALAGLAPALDPARRLGELARLVQAYYRASLSQDIPPASAIAAARELTRLLDQAALSGKVDWDVLPDLASDNDLAGHWDNAVKFLEIVTAYWPNFLRDAGVMDPFVRRLAAASAMAESWNGDARARQTPVIIAGSTGATPASLTLMKGALQLPLGRVILPGLDRDANEAAWTDITETVSHPQHMLARTASALGLPRDKIALWPGLEDNKCQTARRRFVHEALAPAELTADWRERLEEMAGASGVDIERFASDALAGLTLIEAPDEGIEAEIAALLLRETLETEGMTAALVTPDAVLARRVSALLKRWDVQVPPSGGVPLGRTKTGSLIGLVAIWALDPGDPVALAALLKHPFVRWRSGIGALEKHFLRGPRSWSDLSSLREVIERRAANKSRHETFTPQHVSEAQNLLATLHQAAVAHIDWDGPDEAIPGAHCVEIIAALSAELANAPLPWAGEDGAASARMMQSISTIASTLGDMSPRAIVDLIIAESAAMTVSDEAPEHPRLSIWGPLEARLQSADRIILAGLNEDIWPQRTSVDAFLPRRFRQQLGLIDPEDRLGLAAHDFAQLASAPDVVMLYAARRDDAPAVASRWVWRLRTLARGADAENALKPAPEADPLNWAKAMRARGQGDFPDDYSAAPKPNPPVLARPDRLSVTRIGDLQRDPYKIYAEQILQLKELDLLDAEMGAALRGTAVHAALEDFEDEGREKSANALMILLETHLRLAGESEEAWLGRRAVWADTVDWYLNWRAPRGAQTAKAYLERKGELTLDIAGAPFTLSAIADRIELGHDGLLSVIDFKTGTPPGDKEIKVGFDQQMPLQGLIARGGGFEGVAAGDVSELIYVAFKAKSEAIIVGAKKPVFTASELADAAENGLEKLIAEWRAEDAIYLSAPRPKFTGYGTYDRLARRPEWTSEDGEES